MTNFDDYVHVAEPNKGRLLKLANDAFAAARALNRSVEESQKIAQHLLESIQPSMIYDVRAEADYKKIVQPMQTTMQTSLVSIAMCIFHLELQASQDHEKGF